MPVTARQQREFSEHMDRQVRAAIRASDRGTAKAGKLVADSIARMLQRVESLPDHLWTKGVTRQMTVALARQAAEMGIELRELMGAAALEMLERADNAVILSVVRGRVLPLEEVAFFGVVPPEFLSVAAGFRAMLIQKVSTDTVRYISRAIEEGITSGLTQLETIDEILARLRRSKASKLTFPNLAARAETIYRTESLRLFSMVEDARARQLSARFPAMEKEWAARLDGRERADHHAAHEQRVPYSQAFVVGGVRLMYPRHVPATGSRRQVARQTINCRCSRKLIIPKVDARNIDRIVERLRIDPEQVRREIASLG